MTVFQIDTVQAQSSAGCALSRVAFAAPITFKRAVLHLKCSQHIPRRSDDISFWILHVSCRSRRFSVLRVLRLVLPIVGMSLLTGVDSLCVCVAHTAHLDKCLHVFVFLFVPAILVDPAAFLTKLFSHGTQQSSQLCDSGLFLRRNRHFAAPVSCRFHHRRILQHFCRSCGCVY